MNTSSIPRNVILQFRRTHGLEAEPVLLVGKPKQPFRVSFLFPDSDVRTGWMRKHGYGSGVSEWGDEPEIVVVVQGR